jgi:hypothetical protein
MKEQNYKHQKYHQKNKRSVKVYFKDFHAMWRILNFVMKRKKKYLTFETDKEKIKRTEGTRKKNRKRVILEGGNSQSRLFEICQNSGKQKN